VARALVVVGLVAIGVVAVLGLGFVGLIEVINRREPARVAIVVTTGEPMVVRTGVGSRPRSWSVPAQTGVLLPPGDHGTIAILDEGCHLVDTVVQGGPFAWQLITVGPLDATVTLSTTPDATLPPFPEAELTDQCR
jgi:hypothetical protein